MLSPAGLTSAFARDGFVVIPGFADTERVAEMRARVRRYVRDVVPRMPSAEVYYERADDPATLKQIQQMGTHDPWFGRLIGSGPLRAIAETLLHGAVVPKNLQYFDKPPGHGEATPPHQDGHYFMLDPCEAVTMWLALEDVDEESGCVRYVRGSHRDGMREHARTATLGFSQGIVDYPTPDDRAREVAMPARAGDLLVHDARTIHRADANRSVDRHRRALGLIYYSARAREDAAAHAAYQRRLADDLADSGRLTR